MPMEKPERVAIDAVIVLQDRKRLPGRFFGAFLGARLGRVS